MKSTFSAFLIFVTLVNLSCSFPPNRTMQEEKLSLNPEASVSSELSVREKTTKSLSNLPLSFEENMGQADPSVHYLARTPGAAIFLTKEGAKIFPGRSRADKNAPSSLSIEPISSNPAPRILPIDELPGKANYFHGKKQANWKTGISTYAKILYQEIYPGIDLVFYGTDRKVEYDFVVSPNSDPNKIAVRLAPSNNIEKDSNGNLLIQQEQQLFALRRPFAYQDTKKGRKEIPVEYALNNDGSVGFQVASYDRSNTLVIDPVIEYSTYLGSSGFDIGYSIAIDSNGNRYITGYTSAVDFPISAEAYDQSYDGTFFDAYVTKFNATGSALVYSTYLGGSFFDEAHGIAVDANGSAYVVGETSSNDFPVTSAFQSSYGGHSDALPSESHGDGFVTRLSATGDSLIFSTYIGGSYADEAVDIAVDSDGDAYVVGNTASSNFPTKTPLQAAYGGMPVQFGGTPPTGDAFVAKIAAAGDTLVYSTFLGGSDKETGVGIDVDSSKNAYVTGSTSSTDFPTKNPYQAANAGQSDAYIAKIAANGSSLTYSTYLGGKSADTCYGLALDDDGRAHIVGTTWSTDFPLYNAMKNSVGGAYDGFLSKINDSGSALEFSTFIGGSGSDEVYGLAVDSTGFVYLTGYTNSSDLPMNDAPQGNIGGSADAFAMMVRPDGSGTIYSTYIGGSSLDAGWGIAVDSQGKAHVTGETASSNFPTKDAYQNAQMLGQEVFLTVLGAGDVQTDMTVTQIQPTTAGNKGSVSVLVQGTNLYNIASVKLTETGASNIGASQIVESEDGRSLAAVFNLDSPPTGIYNLLVRTSQGDDLIKESAFVITPYVEGSVWVDIGGRKRVRSGRATTFTISYGSTYNVDIEAVPLWIWGSPDDATWKLNFETGPDAPDGQDEETWDSLRDTFQQDGSTKLPLFIKKIPAGGTGTLTLDITYPQNGDFVLNAVINPPMLDPTDTGTFSSSDIRPQSARFIRVARVCLGGLYDTMTSKMTGDLPSNCIAGGFSQEATGVLITEAVPKEVLATVKARDSKFTSQQKFYRRVAQGLHDCGKISASGLKILDYAEMAVKAAQSAKECAEAGGCRPGEYCDGGTPDPPANGSGEGGDEDDEDSGWLDWWPSNPDGESAQDGLSRLFGTTAGAIDPNEKAGPQGNSTSDSNYITSKQVLNYTVFYENLSTATAPAQEVSIVDQLDATKMDLTTLSLGAITFGEKTVTPPPGLTEYTTDVDLRPDEDLLVRITAKLDKATGILSWLFETLDPVTEDLPADPLAGFLPPNATSPEGEGNVKFSVDIKSGITEGTKIENKASIVFDTNDAIVTNTWSNTIDSIAPTTEISADRVNADGTFTLSMSGTDAVSGIKSYNILISEDTGSTYTIWKTTTNTSEVYQGTAGKTYKFVSTGTDNAGNTEDVAGKLDKAVTVFVPLSKCKLKVEKRCKRKVPRMTVCKFRTAIKNENGKRAKKAKYKLEKKKGKGNFRRFRKGRTNKKGIHTLQVKVTKNATYRSTSNKPVCTSNEVKIKVRKKG